MNREKENKIYVYKSICNLPTFKEVFKNKYKIDKVGLIFKKYSIVKDVVDTNENVVYIDSLNFSILELCKDLNMKESRVLQLLRDNNCIDFDKFLFKKKEYAEKILEEINKKISINKFFDKIK